MPFMYKMKLPGSKFHIYQSMQTKLPVAGSMYCKIYKKKLKSIWQH